MRVPLSKSRLQELISLSRTMSELAKRCGLNGKGGSYNTLRSLFVLYDIQCEFDKREGKSPGADHDIVLRSPSRFADTSCLRNNIRLSGTTVRRLMKTINIKEVCRLCGVEDTYNGKTVRLHVDHINGNRYDNRIENLQFLCPNCHSQTETFGRKNSFDYSSLDLSAVQPKAKLLSSKREIDDDTGEVVMVRRNCIQCQKNIPEAKIFSRYCSYGCSRIGNRKLNMNNEHILRKLLENHCNYTKTAKELGVSDNAIRKRLQKAGLLPRRNDRQEPKP